MIAYSIPSIARAAPIRLRICMSLSSTAILQYDCFVPFLPEPSILIVPSPAVAPARYPSRKRSDRTAAVSGLPKATMREASVKSSACIHFVRLLDILTNHRWLGEHTTVRPDARVISMVSCWVSHAAVTVDSCSVRFALCTGASVPSSVHPAKTSPTTTSFRGFHSPFSIMTGVSPPRQNLQPGETLVQPRHGE